MAKDKQKKHEAAGSTAASGKMKRKEFEKELAKLHADLGQRHGGARHRDL